MNTVNIITLWKFEFFFFPFHSCSFCLSFWPIPEFRVSAEKMSKGTVESRKHLYSRMHTDRSASGYRDEATLVEWNKQKKIIEPNEVWGGLAYTHTTHMHALEQYQKQQTKKKRVYNVSVYTMAIGLALAHIIRCIRCVYVKYIDLFVVARWSLGRPKNGNCISIYVGCVCAYVPSLSTSMDALLLCSTIYWYPC